MGKDIGEEEMGKGGDEETEQHESNGKLVLSNSFPIGRLITFKLFFIYFFLRAETCL